MSIFRPYVVSPIDLTFLLEEKIDKAFLLNLIVLRDQMWPALGPLVKAVPDDTLAVSIWDKCHADELVRMKNLRLLMTRIDIDEFPIPAAVKAHVIYRTRDANTLTTDRPIAVITGPDDKRFTVGKVVAPNATHLVLIRVVIEEELQNFPNLETLTLIDCILAKAPKVSAKVYIRENVGSDPELIRKWGLGLSCWPDPRQSLRIPGNASAYFPGSDRI